MSTRRLIDLYNDYVRTLVSEAGISERDTLFIHAWDASFGWLPQYDKGRFYTTIFT